MRKLLVMLLGASLVALGGVAAAQTKKVEMKISHQVPPAHHLNKILEVFATEVKTRSGDTIDVQLFGSEQLSKAADNFPAVARGSIQGALSTNFQWGATMPEMNAISIPYLYTDLEKIRAFPKSEARAYLDAQLAKRGLTSLGWFYITRQGIFTSNAKPLLTIQDFQGVKIRGFNSLNDAGLRAVGAAPVAMPAPEVYQSLQSGILDAGLTDVSAAYSRKFYEVQKYGTVSPHFAIYFHLYVNTKWFQSLTPAQQKALRDAAAKAELAAIDITEKTAEEAISQLQGKGMALHLQSPREALAWRVAMQQPVIDTFLKTAPEGGLQIIELLRK